MDALFSFNQEAVTGYGNCWCKISSSGTVSIGIGISISIGGKDYVTKVIGTINRGIITISSIRQCSGNILLTSASVF